MAKNQWGGYRQPSNPAPVSLPGAQSSRTDGGPIDGMTQPPRYMAGLGYGKGGNMPQQEAAPLAGNTTPVPSLDSLTPLTAPSTRPEEPITHGIDFEGGGGSEAMPRLPNMQYSPSQALLRVAQFDPSGDAEFLYRRLLDNGF